MSKSLFDSIFGWPFNFSDNFFGYGERKSVEKSVDNDKTEISDDKYVFKFKLGDIDFNCLKVSLKDNKLNVSYEKEDENNSIKYHFIRTLPTDADAESIYAETDDTGKILSISMKRKALTAEKKSREIPVSFED